MIAGTLFAIPRPRFCDLRNLRVNPMMIDPLHAVCAFLHHSAAAYGHIGIPHHLELRGIPILEEKEIKPPHFVRTVVRAIARPDAAVVNHVVETFRAMGRCANGTNQLAWRVFTLHARYRLEICFGIIAIALVISVDSQPMHVPAFVDLLFANDGNIIFRLAGDDAVIASHAGIQIDRHSPRVRFAFVVVAGIEREFGGGLSSCAKFGSFL